MLSIAESVFQPNAFTLERRGNKTDAYMRKNIHEVTETIEGTESTHYEWNEAFATFEGLAAPTETMLAEDFNGWYGIVAAWSEDGGKSNEQLRADLDAAKADMQDFSDALMEIAEIIGG